MSNIISLVREKQLSRLGIIVLTIIGTLSGVFLIYFGNDYIKLKTEKQIITPTILPTITVSPSLTLPQSTPTSKSNPKPEVIYKESPVSTEVPTPPPIPTQVTKIDSSLQIELCKTKAETYKTQTMTALVLVYNQNNGDAVKIANTSSVEELVNVGISIGLITREQYNSDPSGHQLALLQTRTKVMAEIKSFMDTVNAKGQQAYNDYYARCLNGEN